MNELGEIHVRWRGLLGNRLFQVAGGLVLAIESGAKMRCLELKGFDRIKFSAPDLTSNLYGSRFGEPLFRLEEMKNLLASGYDVVINGHHEQYRHYRDHKAAIRTLLHFDHPASYAPGPEDLVVHLRLTGAGATEPPDLSYVVKLIKAWRTHAVVIVTDDPSHQFIHDNFREPNTVVVRATKEEDFATLLRAKRLVLTPSTFGWMAAFLGQAEEVFFPFKQGIWARPYIDLWVDDEQRYVKY